MKRAHALSFRLVFNELLYFWGTISNSHELAQCFEILRIENKFTNIYNGEYEVLSFSWILPRHSNQAGIIQNYQIHQQRQLQNYQANFYHPDQGSLKDLEIGLIGLQLVQDQNSAAKSILAADIYFVKFKPKQRDWASIHSPNRYWINLSASSKNRGYHGIWSSLLLLKDQSRVIA